ncbi:hypothetical protein D9V32_08730 [Mycetocola tolaasinivorans]|uniref:Uncharacterized protein n=1 Tax=Mycetocola tolaasinivorans TaxID=76635 RepID=A0A3L7A856_9MICO|nr:hypothetical protein [Mycetocola tolaasinivorans]RLP75552.1 hypothetical protein D9V32_08730 [Mycetocola tolaasinivorans]
MGMVLRRYRWLLILAIPAGFVIGVALGMALTGGDLVAWGEYVLSLGYFSALMGGLGGLGLYLGVELGDRSLTRGIRARVALAAGGAAAAVFVTLLLIGIVTFLTANPGYVNPLTFVLMWTIPVVLVTAGIAALAVYATETGYRKLRIVT